METSAYPVLCARNGPELADASAAKRVSARNRFGSMIIRTFKAAPGGKGAHAVGQIGVTKSIRISVGTCCARPRWHSRNICVATGEWTCAAHPYDSTSRSILEA